MLFFFTVGKPHQVRTLRVQRLLAAVPLCNAWPGAKLPSPCPCPLAAPLSALQAVKPAALLHASLAQTGWERRCSGRQLLSRLRRSLRCSGLRLSCSLWRGAGRLLCRLWLCPALLKSFVWLFTLHLLHRQARRQLVLSRASRTAQASSHLEGDLQGLCWSRRGLGFATVTSLPAFCAEPLGCWCCFCGGGGRGGAQAGQEHAAPWRLDT